jgi:hypothetical protein
MPFNGGAVVVMVWIRVRKQAMIEGARWAFNAGTESRLAMRKG